MKKIFVFFAVLAAMALMISCGGNSSSGGSSVSNFGKLGGECYPNETCDEGFLCDTENNICVEDPENPVQDSDTSSEQTNDNVDTQSEQNDDKTDTLPENDNDSADDGDTIDPDITDSGETDGETRVQDCTGLPENAEWNTVSSITQRWDGEKWVPSAVASFNFEGSENECRFKCVSGYTWDGSQCVQPSDPCNPNPCTNMPNSKGTCIIDSTSYVCGCNPGYEWNGTSCVVMTREINCTEKPENAVWNTVSSITQTYDGSEWYPSATGVYSTVESTSECHFKCNTHYNWNSSSKTCVAETQQGTCSSKPSNTVWNDNGANGKFTQTWTGSGWNPSSYTSTYSTSAGVCRYTCASGYTWNGSTCASNGSSTLPECSASSGTPCIDSTSGLVWSARASSYYTWANAVSYCDNLTEGGYSDWHLPTIDELRTLLIASRVSANCQVSEENNCLSFSSCWSCSSCTQTGTQSSSGTGCSSWGTSYSDGRYSKFGETRYFWSSSTLSDSTVYAWLVGFDFGYVNGYSKTTSHAVRCVR